MPAKLRQTGIEALGEMPSGTYFCHFSETKPDLLDVLVAHFQTGLGSGILASVLASAAVHITPPVMVVVEEDSPMREARRSDAGRTGSLPCWTAALRLALLMLALDLSSAVAQTAVKTARTIRVVMDNSYAPYSFQSDEGKLQGILIDQWQAWEKKTGIKVEIHAMDWVEALRRMRAGEFDVIDSIVETAERRDYFDFTPAYTPVEASIFFRKDISGITDLASLKGFPVGIKAGDQHADQLKVGGVATMILFQNSHAIIDAAKQRKIKVFVVDNPSALYLLNKAGIEGEFRHSAPRFRY